MSVNKPTTIDEYIEAASPEAKPRLLELRKCLRTVAPDAEEGLKWGNPAFTQKRVLFAFAAYKNHINSYPTPAVIEAFQNELSDYRTTDAALQLPLDAPIPTKLIDTLARYRLKEVLEHDAKWM